MSGAGQPWRAVPGGVTLRVRVTPKGGADAVEGVVPTAEGFALKLRVRAAPHDGAANAAVIALTAKMLVLPPSRIALQSGAAGRLKILRIEGDPQALAARLAGLATRTAA